MHADTKYIFEAFKRVADLSRTYGDAIPRKAIAEGFRYQNEKVLLDNQAVGIFKPRQMFECAISIKTTMRRDGSDGIYNDHRASDGFYKYSLQSGDPLKGNNKYLWASKNANLPFIYFHAVSPGFYTAIWPCFITEIHPEKGYALISEGSEQSVQLDKPTFYQIPDPVESQYCVRETKVRMHQASFRQNILQAYSEKCAITGLDNRKLLEAAHIIPDSRHNGAQHVNDGIAMSRLHHRAYDANLMGITPDYKIQLSEEIKSGDYNEFVSSAFLIYEGQKLKLPRNADCRPNQDKLAERFEEFNDLN